MTTLLLLVLAAECVALLAWGMAARGRVLEYPFLAGAVFAGFVLPQAWGLAGSAGLPPGGLDKTLLMTLLSAGACFLGYRWGREPPPPPASNLDLRHLAAGGILLLAVGIAAHVAISGLPAEVLYVSRWSGMPVAYNFFARVLPYGFAICLVLALSDRSLPCRLAVAAGTLVYLDRIVLGARRGIAVEFVLIVLCSVFFVRGRTLPRLAMLGLLAAATLVVYATSDYRAQVLGAAPYGSWLVGTPSPDWQTIASIPYVERLHGVMRDGNDELRAAVFAITSKSETLTFDFGLFHWNGLVDDFVPAQLVGQELKDQLRTALDNDSLTLYGFVAHTGTTHTGMADAYASFWYLGCAKFFGIAWALRRLYSAARDGSLPAQLAYMLLLPSGLLAISHNTNWPLSVALHLSLFLGPVLLLSRRRDAGAEVGLLEPSLPPAGAV